MSENFALANVMRTADMLIRNNLSVKPGEQVLIIADYVTDFIVVNAIASACTVVGAEPTITVMPPRAFNGAPPTRIVEQAAIGADVIISPASTPMTYSKFRWELTNAKKTRFCTMPGINADQMTHGASQADYNKVERTTKRLAEIYRGKTVRVTSEFGCDITAGIEGVLPMVVAGFAREKGLTCCFPDGETPIIPPNPGTAEGILVWDTSAHTLKMLIEPLKMSVKKGKVVEVFDSKDAPRFKKILEDVGDEGRYITEFSIGTNPMARITGNVSEDKKGIGRVHIAVGTYGVSGKDAAVHIDGVIQKPTVEVDGKIIVEKGALKIDL
ncbi:MAG: aminopeptidase [Candidatus Hodarchaeota archaeon]